MGGRRSGTVVRELLLTQARDAFAHEGYAAATTRDIAERAGIAEALISRYCGSKDELFRWAVLEPARGIAAELAWSPRAGEDPVAAWSRHVVDLVQAHRDVLTALFHRGVCLPSDTEVSGEMHAVAADIFSALDAGAAAATGRPMAPGWSSARAAFAMILSVVALEGPMFGPRNLSAEQIEHLVAWVAHGESGATRREMLGTA